MPKVDLPSSTMKEKAPKALREAHTAQSTIQEGPSNKALRA